MHFSDSYKENKISETKLEIQQERDKRFNELHRLFAERGDRIHTVNQLLKSLHQFCQRRRIHCAKWQGSNCR